LRIFIDAGVGFSPAFVFLWDSTKTDAARISKLYIDMFHHEFFKLIYFVGQRSRSRCRKKTVQTWVLALFKGAMCRNIKLALVSAVDISFW